MQAVEGQKIMRWEQRPIEIANLLNPAFCAILLHDTVDSYTSKDSRGMNYLLVFLILPLILHGKTRKTIPLRNNVLLSEWAKRQKINNLFLVEHIRQMVPFTKEALIFSIQQGAIVFGNQDNNSSNILPTSKSLRSEAAWSTDSIPIECRSKARVIGEWFAEIGDVSTIYRTLEIRP